MRAIVAFAMLALSSFTAPWAHAQANDEMIVVTASRIESEDGDGNPYPSPPSVSLKVAADFVMFTVRLESSTTERAARMTELKTTNDRLARRAATAQGVTIEVGEPGQSSALESATATEVIEQDYGDDRAYIPLVMKFAVRPNERFGGVRSRAEAFIDAIEESGRVEIVTGDLQYAGVNDAGRHRETLLRKIAADTQLLRTIFTPPGGGAPDMSINGLEARVQFRPSGPLELELFVPYFVELSSPERD